MFIVPTTLSHKKASQLLIVKSTELLKITSNFLLPNPIPIVLFYRRYHLKIILSFLIYTRFSTPLENTQLIVQNVKFSKTFQGGT